MVNVDKEEWIKVEGTHDAIVSKEVFEQVQELALMDTRKKKYSKEMDVMIGFLRCGDCGENMVTRYGYSKKKKYTYYTCSAYKYEQRCSSHLIRTEIVQDAVLQAIQFQIKLLADAEGIVQMADVIPEQNFDVRLIDNQIRETDERIERFRNLRDRLYQDMVDEIISKEEYQDMSERFSKQLKAAEESKNKLQKKKHQIMEESKNPYRWLDAFKEYRNITKITRKALLALVDYVTVYSKERIEVTFKYGDAISNYLKLADDQRTNQ